MPFPSPRRTLVYFFALSVLGSLCSTSASALDEPRRVSLRATLRFRGVTLEVRGLFRERNTLLSAQAPELPASLSGAYDLVIMARGQSLFVMPVSSGGGESEEVRDLCEIPGDARLDALDIDAVLLFDGDVIVAADEDVATAARVTKRAVLRMPDDPGLPAVLLEARAQRSHDGSARYEIDVMTRRMEPGAYEIRFSGEKGDLVVPFFIAFNRNRARVSIREDEDRVSQFAAFERATLSRNGVDLSCSPLH